MKWGSPCYTVDGKNVVMLVALTECCALSFFQGAALTDPDGVLQSPGPNSHYGRYLRFTSSDEVTARRAEAERFLAEAIALSRAGHRIEKPARREPVPDELARRLERSPAITN
jgi:uncharacterized protein YdeI (YjbR/CyaY-like superfamily)